MDVQAFIDAYMSPQYNQWKESHSGENDSEILNLIQSSSFQSWIKSNPQGTVDQYLRHTNQIRQYHQSPQYRIEILEAEVETLRSTIEGYRKDSNSLRIEISEKEDEISSLSSKCTILSISTLLLFIVAAFLFIRQRKSKIL